MTELIGASVWEQEIYSQLLSHEENEQELLEQYRDAAESSPSMAFRYLSSLILEDEKRHHRLFVELASTFKSEAELGGAEPVVPRLDWGSDADRVVKVSEQLLEQEHADAKELRALAGRLKDVKDFTIWQLLVRIMEMDTAKHIEILNFTKRHAQKSTK